MRNRLIDDEDRPLREPYTDREIAEAIPRPTGVRCKLHNTPDCWPCEHMTSPEGSRPSSPANSELPTPALNPAPAAKPISVADPKVTEQDLQKARIFLDVPGPIEEETIIESRRRFFQPLPVGKLIEMEPGKPIVWPKKFSCGCEGMTVENIAMFLSMPQVLYTDWEENKNNPPKEIFLTPLQAFDHPTSSDAIVHESPIVRAMEGGVAPVGVEDIIATAKPTEIQTDALANVPGRQLARKIPLPVPTNLLFELKKLQWEKQTLSARFSKSHGGLTGRELKTAKQRNARAIEKIENDIASYTENWGKVEVPGTGVEGRESFVIEIPPCPQGAIELFTLMGFSRGLLRRYIQKAWGSEAREEIASVPEDEEAKIPWQYYYTDFENEAIEAARCAGVFSEYPLSDLAKAKWELDGRPSAAEKELEGYERKGSRSARHQRLLRRSPDGLAKEAALRGYRRTELGEVMDPTIRRVGRTTPTDRLPGESEERQYGSGTNPYADEKDDWGDAEN
jgi:hypothetical protein